jgi:hypothetical protein
MTLTPARPLPTPIPARNHRATALVDRSTQDETVPGPVVIPSPVRHGANAAATEGTLLSLQRACGNAHVARLVVATVQRHPAGKTISIGSEQVIVADDKEKAEAEQIFKEVRERYGVRMSSSSGINAIDLDYDEVPAAVRKQVKTQAWKMEELRALVRALAHFAPILGKERASSSRSRSKQETATASKLDIGIDENSPKGKFAKDLRAQQFDAMKNITLYSSLTEFPPDFKGDRVREIEGIITHELAHGLLDYAVDDYLKNLDYWKDAETKSGKAGAEAPITKYGAKNIDEDLGEAARFYFLAPGKLKDGLGKKMGEVGNPCKKRFDLIDGYVKAWKRTPPKQP